MSDPTNPEPQLQRYVVHAANIKGADGQKVNHGEIVELTPRLARHYNKLGYLRPYIPESGADDNEARKHGRAHPAQRRSTGEDLPAPRANRATSRL